LAFRILVAVFILAALGFPVFVWSLARASSDPEPADAIVALTGGEGRLAAGLQLLDQGKGARLLISGVHAETSRTELFEAVGQLSPKAACCVDLGRSAESTIGNANETAAWVQRRGYKSIIVVTATYHMPRSLMELHYVLPDTKLVAYPVFPDRVRMDEWWSDGETSGVLAWSTSWARNPSPYPPSSKKRRAIPCRKAPRTARALESSEYGVFCPSPLSILTPQFFPSSWDRGRLHPLFRSQERGRSSLRLPACGPNAVKSIQWFFSARSCSKSSFGRGRF
jgi:uncharacterized SAM-binding protein YcdF (DUF218 family)